MENQPLEHRKLQCFLRPCAVFRCRKNVLTRFAGSRTFPGSRSRLPSISPLTNSADPSSFRPTHRRDPLHRSIQTLTSLTAGGLLRAASLWSHSHESCCIVFCQSPSDLLDERLLSAWRIRRLRGRLPGFRRLRRRTVRELRRLQHRIQRSLCSRRTNCLCSSRSDGLCTGISAGCYGAVAHVLPLKDLAV